MLAIRLRATEVPGAALHWYGKAESRPGRKMGHVTVTSQSDIECMERATAVMNYDVGER